MACVAIGAGKTLEQLEMIRRSMPEL
jgi:hypothetical protein